MSPSARSCRRGATLVLVAALVVCAPAAAQAPPDLPALDQYADPFGPLGTGHQAPAWNPFTSDFQVSPPRRVLRPLEGVEDEPALRLLLTQLETERVRTSEGRSATRHDAVGSDATGARADDEDAGFLTAAAGSVFDRGGLWALLLIGGLAVIAGVGAAARRSTVRA